MRVTMALLILAMTAVLGAPATSLATKGDLTVVIDRFVTMQYPEAKSYFWVVNDTQWQTDDEVVIDLNTVVVEKGGDRPTASRYLLLIVGDHLAASQNIPLDTEADCAPEQQA